MKYHLKIIAFILGSVLLSVSHADVCQVPLKIVNIGSTKYPSYKIGINVGLGGGSPRLYEFDTGGSAFWAAYNPELKPGIQWWGDTTQVSEGGMSIQYTSGNEYTANLVATKVALYPPSARKKTHPLCSTPDRVNVAQITNFTNTKNKDKSRQWVTRIKNNKGPLYRSFWGDFGAALHPSMSANGLNGAYTVLNQFQTGANHNGFIVHIGNLSKPNKQRPYVQIGLNHEDLNSFPYQFKMNSLCPAADLPSANCPSWSSFSNSAVNTFMEAQLNGDVTLNSKGGIPNSELLPEMGIIIDSGATFANIFQNPNCINNCTVPGSFIQSPRPVPDVTPTIYRGLLIEGHSAVITGKTLNNNEFKTTLTQSSHPLNSSIGANYSLKKHPTGGQGTMNTGILLYSSWDVMFDITSGIVGFRHSN